jgi:hypothetical protein
MQQIAEIKIKPTEMVSETSYSSRGAGGTDMNDPSDYPEYPPTKYPGREATTMTIAGLLVIGAIGLGASVLFWLVL